MSKEVTLRSQAATRPAAITFARPLELDGHILKDEEDLAGLVKMGLQLTQSHPVEARDYFLKAAEKVPGTELEIAALGAAAMSQLNAGDRETFLEILGRLEAALARQGRLAPPPEITDLVALGRYMKRDHPLAGGGSQRLRDLLNDLERSR